jgi:alkylhydroperoxidase family enzyme
MPRLDPIEEHDGPAEARPYYEADVSRYGVVLNNTKMYAHNVAILKAIKEFALAFGRANTLPTGLKSMIRVRVAALNQCPF